VSTENRPLDGLLVVDKPGREDLVPIPMQEFITTPPARSNPLNLFTSHDIVARVRRWSGQRRIGHTGTLDPLASGLLLLCLGSATRLVEYYQHQPKRYRAVITLGGVTDTYDAAGRLLEQFALPTLASDDIERALAPLRGVVAQQAPRFSAIKQEGKTLYRLARRGETVEPPTRTVTFSTIDLLSFTPPDRVTLRVECSAGAYIRSLAHDLGVALNTGAYLQALRRETVGAFTLAEAHSLEAIEAAGHAGQLDALLLPLGDRLPLPRHHLDQEALRRLGFGQIVVLPHTACEAERSLAAAVDDAGALVGIMRRLSAAEAQPGWCWKAEKWLQ